jgi:hypothetical protein
MRSRGPVDLLEDRRRGPGGFGMKGCRSKPRGRAQVFGEFGQASVQCPSEDRVRWHFAIGDSQEFLGAPIPS